MKTVYVNGKQEKLKGYAAWLRETFVFEGPRDQRDGYYIMHPEYMEITLLTANVELFVKIKLGADCQD